LAIAHVFYLFRAPETAVAKFSLAPAGFSEIIEAAARVDGSGNS
jgi:hypothetical protein